jgi:murein DD-endopeptidase MepM/ murein hydrolase activator NlpD
MNPKPEVQINLILLASLLTVIMIFNPIRAGAAPVGEASAPGWSAPVFGPVLRLFQRPLGPYLAGHRGVDYPAVVDEPVFSPADGVVSYVGLVFDRVVVVVDHGHGVKSEVEPICPSVVVGEPVIQGSPLGVFCEPKSAYRLHCAGVPCLHFSIRKNGEYYAPQVLLGGLQASRLKAW